MAKKALLLKVLVQTVWVEVDEESGSAVEQTSAPSIVSAADWPSFYERWQADFAALQASMATEVPAVALNRAQRRSRATTNGAER